MPRVTVNLSDGEKQKLDHLCIDRRCSQSQVLRSFLAGSSGKRVLFTLTGLSDGDLKVTE
jgi:hypothetical protein